MLRRTTNHPVHIQDDDGTLYPSALIPFCEFGGNMSVMGVKVGNFQIPFCTGFEEKIINDKLCYTIDLNKKRHKEQVKEVEDLTLRLFISYNEDRQLNSLVDLKKISDDLNLDEYILIETIGKPLDRSWLKSDQMNSFKKIYSN